MAVMAAVDAVLLRHGHQLQAGGDGLGGFLEARQHPALLDAVPDAVVDGIGEGLEDGLDHADGQGDAPVAGQGEGDQDGHDQVHEAVARDLEREASGGADQYANHSQYLGLDASGCKAIPLILPIARAWGCGSPPWGVIRGPQNGDSLWRYAKA
ncbi:hypothetical protein D3C86_1568210 [compost metagenome]